MAVVQKKETGAVPANSEDKAHPAQEQPRLDEKLMEPGAYEVTKDSTFVIEIWLARKSGRWVVTKAGDVEAIKHTCTFRMWNYNEMVDMRKTATAYDPNRRMHLIDNDALNRLKVQKLLLSWDFDKANPRLKLHRVQGVLTDESWEMFAKLQPNIITYIVERMNDIFEYNG